MQATEPIRVPPNPSESIVPRMPRYPVALLSRPLYGLVFLLLAGSLSVGCGDDEGGDAPDAGLQDAGEPDAGGKTGDACERTADCSGDLMCADGECQTPTCMAGETGCMCGEDDSCRSSADACSDELCKPVDCQAGEENCECLGGGCDPGLHCRDGKLCVDNDGYEGGSCFDNGRCNAGNACDPWLEICVHCDAGSQGCQCKTDGACGSGLACTAGLCIVAGQIIPQNPVCYTPCQDDLVSDDGVRRCDSDGLLSGCVDGRECNAGSCVMPGEDPPSCKSDMECPSHQACIQGRCYSNCEGHADCVAGLACYRKVCRLPCSASAAAQNECPDRMYCETVDGENGFCTLQAPAAGDVEQTEVSANITVTPSKLNFSNVQISGKANIALSGSISEEIKIRKLSHTVYYRGGNTETLPAAGDDPDSCEGAKCPLWWLEVAAGSNTYSTEQTLMSRIASECEPGAPECTLSIKNAGAIDAARWVGVLEVSGAGMNTQRVRVSYVSRPDGRWEGAMYYFGTFGDENLDAWLSDKSDVNIERVDNGLLRRWHAYRKGRINGGWDEFRALLTATRTGSWNWNSTNEACRVYDAGDPQRGGACYLYDDGTGGDGTRTYVSTLAEAPIPTGAIEFPIALNLWMPDATAPRELAGRIDTVGALHYPANPAVRLQLSADAADDSVCDNDGVKTDCVNTLSLLESHIFTGGRYLQRPNASGAIGACPDGYQQVAFPWLLPGFQGTSILGEGNRNYRYECRRESLPFDPMGDASIKALNAAMAGANPVPDGVGRARHLSLIDGALINQEELFVLFREEFDPFMSTTDPDAAFSAYGYMILRREASDLETSDKNDNQVPDAYEGNDLSMVDGEPSRLGTGCTEGLLPDDNANVEDKVKILIEGEDPQVASVPVPSSRVHYVCHDTGVIDGGSEDTGANPVAIACPPGSNVTFFVVDAGTTKDQLISHSCNSDVQQVTLDDSFDISGQATTSDGTFTPNNDIFGTGEDTTVAWRGGTCLQVVKNWATNKAYGTVLNPVWRCDRNQIPLPDDNNQSSSAQVEFQNQGLHCDDRLNLAANKQFFVPGTGNPPWFVPLRDVVPEAFRYKTRFQTSKGGQIGFAPEICIENSNQAPYCYDPAKVEEIRDRVNCLLSIYQDDSAYARLETLASGTDPDSMAALPSDDWRREVLDLLNKYLKKNFKVEYITVPTLSAPLQEPGFERLNAELLITLGDESLTAAFASRFDLAGAGGAAFEGSKFEPGGIDLSGVAGFEMHSLYQATQYYQDVLDRFYFMSPVIWAAMQRGDTESASVFITPNTVTTYFDKLVRASTQKARAWSEIAKRYQGFNRPDLARSVVERAYVSTYLESVILSQLISKVVVLSRTAARPQLLVTVEDAMRRYRMAMLDMATVHVGITDDVTYFGFEPDYVPFPALDANSMQNAFEVLLSSARAKTQFAAERERLALQSNRSLKTDQATFQAELTRIRNNYENQLGDVCGTMVTRDGRILPAIEKYAHLNDDAALLGDPCGFFGNGQIYTSSQELEVATINQQSAINAYDKVISLIEIEKDSVEEQCEAILDASQHIFELRGEITTLENQVRKSEIWKDRSQRWLDKITSVAQTAVCFVGTAGTDCVGAAIAATTIGVASAAAEVAQVLAEENILDKQKEIGEQQNALSKWEADSQCETVKIQGRANMRRLRLELGESVLEGLRAEFRTRQAIAETVRLRNLAKRLQGEQKEAEELTINVEAARNDPNVRIYRNDAVINADIAFTDALRQAYRATRVFEYYTSQSYASLEKLFLTRMITAGDYNLENYLIELQNSFYEFEESFGIPDTRVMIISMRDDILRIPYEDDGGSTISQGQRIDMMRERLRDPGLLDSKGYLALPFNTKLAELSPLTRNHKVLYLEADIIGSSVGDNVGRLYLRQLGTGTVLDVTNEKDYYRFPERTAVVNPIFNGNRGVFAPAVYRNYRMRDRPLVNSNWELVINQRDEAANQDLDLQSLSDIRLYVYYSDFTAL